MAEATGIEPDRMSPVNPWLASVQEAPAREPAARRRWGPTSGMPMKKVMLDSTQHSDRLVIYPSRVKMSLVLLGAIAFVLAGLWIGASGIARVAPIWEVFIATYVGVPFFAACGLYAAYRLVIRRPALEIDWMGITDTSSALGAGRLGWEEVDHLVLYQISGQSMLGIVPRDLGLFLSRQNAVRRSLTRLNLAWGFAPINVAAVGVPMKLAELADLLHTRYGVRVEGGA